MRKTIVGISGILMAFILACNAGSSVTTFDESAVSSTIPFQPEEYNLDQQDWPVFLPDAIPPFPGMIDTIIADEETLRIYFSDLALEDFVAYLKDFEDSGYDIQYLIYASDGQGAPGSTDIAAFDAVKLLKDDIAIQIEFENNAGVMAINIGQLGIKVKQGHGWPSILSEIFPEDICTLETLYIQTDGTINIMCLTRNGDFLTNYAEQLQSSGFEVLYQFSDQNNEVYKIELAKGKMKVEIRAYNAKKTGITVRNYK